MWAIINYSSPKFGKILDMFTVLVTEIRTQKLLSKKGTINMQWIFRIHLIFQDLQHAQEDGSLKNYVISAVLTSFLYMKFV